MGSLIGAPASRVFRSPTSSRAGGVPVPRLGWRHGDLLAPEHLAVEPFHRLLPSLLGLEAHEPEAPGLTHVALHSHVRAHDAVLLELLLEMFFGHPRRKAADESLNFVFNRRRWRRWRRAVRGLALHHQTDAPIVWRSPSLTFHLPFSSCSLLSCKLLSFQLLPFGFDPRRKLPQLYCTVLFETKPVPREVCSPWYLHQQPGAPGQRRGIGDTISCRIGNPGLALALHDARALLAGSKAPSHRRDRRAKDDRT